MTVHNVPALPAKIDKLVADYQKKREAIPDLIAAYAGAADSLKASCCLGGTYAGDPLGYVSVPSAQRFEETLRESAWRHVYKIANVDMIASAADRQKFDRELKQAPEFTEENVMATFGPYLTDARYHILKGLAECFSTLDPAYKSHCKVKIGVQGLPKRVIINNAVSEYSFNSYGADKLKDMLNCLEVLEGRPHLEYTAFDAMTKEAKRWGETDFSGGKIKAFRNGNVHVHFSKEALRKINLGLAEFYGEVLAENDYPRPDKPASTAVSKDLAFYWTGPDVAERVIGEISALNRDRVAGWVQDQLPQAPKVLEPSCGEGHLLDAIRASCPHALAVGVEVHGGRAAKAEAKGHKVQRGNFLEIQPEPVFDAVVMNPPFAGDHWKKHLLHALKFLRNGEKWNEKGKLVCILPASAEVDGHLKELGIGYRWYDLPIGCFRAAGTNVNTGFIVCGAQ
ncbi:class I SAM-dependent methyltransferase [Phaeobacter gallaeciensis]|uniref:class I SAM-dependent methyltransferase n=1 Tax=Phaeobacter gallaeciensis TaxID=60890 RepID=UPI00237F6DD0|nr:class I SAM-dependent methyltransferase [Phaeobacter gallaeciensis]MDE4189656.1 DUF4942 domain-containing protein [Phaeobacter gallaeciensis]MDE4198808.1 DUF4942 domain-containing protein [Phaeobacter gallaeciensis]MDE4202955.1 DUF4942 domain-containing protein [Phaeobacter gallaeciensis]MDE4207098.1 DUF4942 domain-containing protein [Phaeobacter gallaeciensis]MDE4215678.1 DUF4942 domain-containing protein [Phaeobacter gallaeciensis]